MKHKLPLVCQRNGNSCGVAGLVVLMLVGAVGSVLAVITLIGAIFWKVRRSSKKRKLKVIEAQEAERLSKGVEFLPRDSIDDSDEYEYDSDPPSILMAPPRRSQIIALCLVFLCFVAVVAFRMLHH